MIKVLNVDLMCKEHNYKNVFEYLNKRWNSPGIQSIEQINRIKDFEVQLFQLARKLKKDLEIDKNGVEIHLFKAQPVFYPNKKYFNYRMYSRSLEKYTLKFNPHIVHINQTSGNNLYKYCKFLTKNGFKYILHYRGGNLTNFNKKRMFIFEKAKAVIVNNNMQKKELLKIFKHKEKIHIIPQGINFENFKCFNKKKETLTFGFTGRLYEHKGLLEALDFIYFIKSKNNNVTFYIAGNFETKTFIKTFYNKIKNLNLEYNIVYEGYLTGEKLTSFYNKFTYLLFLSKHESFGKSVIEAMASGVIPIIKKNSSGPEEIIGNGKYGYILPRPENWEKFYKILTNENNIEELRKKIKERVKEYSFEAFTNKLINLYKLVNEKL